MKKQTGGPVTKDGKAVSSGNALKHGATASKLLNQNEKDRYEELLAELATE